MRVFICVLMLIGLSACHGHRGGSAHVDGIGGASWGGSSHHSGHGGKGCPPGLAKQGRC